MNFYISDTHFGHGNIVRFDESNGGKHFESIEEHDKLIIDNWNHVVTNSDNVYILGDFSFLSARDTQKIIESLNGAKFLIKGNHDHWEKDGACKKLFQGIYDYKTITDDSHALVLSHYPILFYQGQHRGAIHLYGHVHNTVENDIFKNICRQIGSKTDIPMNVYNVGAMIDYMGYTPRTLKEILAANN